MSSPASSSSSYLPHINGLRALAILGILFYHLRASYCPAGYFGVDLFLVISGFLLLRSFMKVESAGDFHYGQFLIRKAWRILPSWFVVTIAVCVAGALLMNYMHFGGALKTARYSAVFLADYQIDKSGNYFNELVQQNPLLHLWYLSITEQLYLLAPLLMLLLTFLHSRALKLIILFAAGALSLAYYVLTTTAGIISPETQISMLSALGYQMTYYHLIPRAWEIMAGGLVLLLPAFETRRLLRALLSLAALTGLILSFFLYETSSPHVYLTVACALLLIKYGDAGLCGWLLNRRLIQALGTISFSVYLWHWPVMVFWKYLRFDKPGLWDEVGMLTLSLILGTLAWWAIERLKMPKGEGKRGAWARYGLLFTLPAVFGLAIGGKHYFRDSMPSYSRSEVPPFKEDPEVLRGFPDTSADNAIYHTPPRTIGNAEAADQIPFFLLMGDSHGYHLYDGLYEQCREHQVRGVMLNNSVAPYWNVHRVTKTYGDATWTPEKADALLHYLQEHPELRYVLIVQRWDHRLTVSQETDHDWRTGASLRDLEAFSAATSEGLRETCRQLQALGRKVILLGSTPVFDHPSPMDEWNRCSKLGLPMPERSISREEHANRQSHTWKLLHQLQEEGLATCIDLAEPLRAGDSYPARMDGEFLYVDTNHLSRAGSERTGKFLLPQLLEMAQKDGVQLRRENAPATAP